MLLQIFALFLLSILTLRNNIYLILQMINILFSLWVIVFSFTALGVNKGQKPHKGPVTQKGNPTAKNRFSS